MTTTPAVVVKSIDPQVPLLPEKIVLFLGNERDRWWVDQPDRLESADDAAKRIASDGTPVRIIRLHADAPVCTDAMVAQYIREYLSDSTRRNTQSDAYLLSDYPTISDPYRAGFAAALAAMGVGNE